MRIYIKNIQLFISLILFPFGIINFLYFLCRDFKDPFRLKFMTWWNLYINSIYFIVVLICDISLYFNNRKMEKINFFFREHYSPICTTLTILVTIIFWFFIYLPLKIKNEKKLNELGNFYENFYVHFLITIIQIFDIFYAQKTFKASYLRLRISGGVRQQPPAGRQQSPRQSFPRRTDGPTVCPVGKAAHAVRCR